MSNKLVLYNVDFSPPVRTVKIVAKLIGVELEIRLENLIEDFLLKNDFYDIEKKSYSWRYSQYF